MKTKVNLKNIALGVLGIFAIIIIGFLLREIALLYIDSTSIDEKIFAKRKDIIALIAQIIGGFGFLLGAFFIWKRIDIMQRNLETAQEGQITERFTKAIEQLGATDDKGNPKMEIRLGGIYALERIARDSKADHWTVMEVLTAYVRRNSPWPSQNGERFDQSDIRAICQMLRQRELKHEEGETRRFDLSNTNLVGVDLHKANLERDQL